MKEFPFSKKFTSMGSKHQLNPTLAFFLMKFFSITKKKSTRVGSSAFQKNVQQLDQTNTFFDIF